MTETDPYLDNLAASAGARLRETELDVPAEVSQRLQASRRLAVARAESTTGEGRIVWPQFFGFAATAFAAFVLVVGVTLTMSTPDGAFPRLNDGEIAAAQEADFLQELEFVAWMVAMEDTDELPKSG